MKKLLLSFSVLVVFAFTTNVFSQAVGDYGSAASANWGVASTWVICQTAGTWADAIPAGGVPGQTNNIWIRSGHTVTVEASGKTFLNLTVENGASLVGANTLPTSSLRYIRIYGSTLTNNGNIGSSTDCLGLSLYGGSGQVATVTGSGTTNFSRIQQNSGGTTLVFDADVNINYAGSSGTGSTALYNSSGNSFTVIINAGKTLTMAPSAYIAASGTSGSSAGNSAFTFDIYGTLVTQNNSIINLNNTSPYSSVFTVYNGGVVNLGSILRGDAGTGGVLINVQNGGTINGLSGSTFSLSLATLTIDGIVDFGLSSTATRSLGTATIGSTGKLRFRDGTYPTGSVTLNAGSTVEYYGGSAITLGTSPTSYSNLLISNTAGVSLGTGLTISNLFSILSGSSVDLGSYNHTAEYLQLAGVDQTPGTHGSTASSATYKNATYFGTTATGILTVNGALPVELASFTAIVGKNGVLLKWVTKTETNNLGWDVERASFSTSPIQGWEKIGFVNGAGNSNSPKEYSFTHKPGQSGKYFYRLKQIDNDGSVTYSNEVEVNVQTPQAFLLDQNYPNPFNPSTTIGYQLASNSFVTLKVYDLIGNEIATLVNEQQEAGYYSIPFSTSEKQLANGIYIYKIQAGDFTQTKKMMLIK